MNAMTVPTLTGQRVTLRAIQPEDEQARLSLGWHAAIERSYGRHVQTRQMTPAEARAWYERQQARAADPSGCHWVIEAEGHLMGVTRLHAFKETDSKAHSSLACSHPATWDAGSGRRRHGSSSATRSGR